MTLGQVEDGITLDYFMGGEEIRGDNFGDTIQDFVFRGGDCFMTLMLLEYDLVATSKALWYWSTTFGKIDDAMIGRLGTGFAKPLVLTGLVGPTANPSVAGTLTATKAILAPRFNISLLFGPRLRRVPIRFQLLPFQTSGPVNQFFVQA